MERGATDQSQRGHRDQWPGFLVSALRAHPPPGHPIGADVKVMIVGQLDATQRRLAAIGQGRDADSGATQPSGAQPGSS